MATIFDHNKKCFTEAMGLDDKDMDQTNSKLADMSQFIVHKGPKISELTEEIAKVFSYNELLILSTLYVIEKTNTILIKHPDILVSSKLKELLDILDKEEEE